MKTRVTHLDAVQAAGSPSREDSAWGAVGEAWKEAYKEVRRLSTGAADTAMRQEHWQSFGLCPKAGQCDG